jgi:hypothetical protein
MNRGLVLLAAVLLIGIPALAIDIGPQVAVSSYRLDPPVLMKGDTGVVTVQVSNSGPESVYINSARLSGGAEVTVIQSPDETQGAITSGSTVAYVFKVRAEGSDGVYYLRFILDFREGGSSTFSIPVQVESSTLKLSIIKIPDPLIQGVRGDILVMIGNPRPNAANAVTLEPEGDGFLIAPSGVFLGTLEPDGSSLVTFNVTPLRQTFIRFRATFRNGINTHTATLTIPLSPVDNKIAAEPVLTNIRVTTGQGAIHISGNITNVGLVTAHSVTITTQGEVTPADPNKVYVVGSLEPDAVAPFDVSFRSRSSVGEVPLLITFKDSAGTILTRTTSVELSSQVLSDQGSEPSRFMNLLIWMFVILVAAVFIYFWRRG